MAEKLGEFILFFPILLLSLSFHEASHAWTANRFGDDTAYHLGRITLNPIPHIDLFGTLLFPILAFFSGWPLIGWAKPVPVNTNRLTDVKKGHILVSLAGPGSNLLLAIIFFAVYKLIQMNPGPVLGILGDLGAPLMELLAMGVLLNILLAVFNVIPVPPLDGHWVLYHLLPYNAAQVFDQLRPYGFILLYALLLTGALGYIFRPVYQLIIAMLR